MEINVKNNVSKYTLTKLYVYFMFLIYPFFFHNYYFDIVTCKYILFMVITGIEFVISIFYLPDAFFEKIKNKKIKLYISDYLMIAFMVINIISVCISDNMKYAVSGADGRNMGLSTVICLTFIYFLITRTFEINNMFYKISAIGSILVSIVGILQFAGIDIFGFYNQLEFSQKLFYMSTLGHIDVYTSYFSITIPVIYMNYLKSDRIREKIFYFTALVFNLTGVICGQCDSSYIVLFISIFVVMIFIGKICKKVSLSEFILPIVITELITKILLELNKKAVESRTIGAFTKIFFSDNVFLLLVIILGISVLIETKTVINMVKLKKVYIFTLCTGIAGYIVLVICFSTLFKEKKLGELENILRFGRSYGSYRGYIWKVLIKDFKNMSIKNKLFGIGTDSLKPYLINRYGDKMYKVTNAYYDNAHNEFLQYLVTTGIFGLASYIGIVVVSIKNALKDEKKLIPLVGVICYLGQSVVNINQVVTTPLFFIMISFLNINMDRKRNNQ